MTKRKGCLDRHPFLIKKRPVKTDLFKGFIFIFEKGTGNKYGYLWSSMRNMDDIFGYGSDHAVCDKNGNWTIMMPEEVKKEVKKHPEQYAVIKLIYD